MWKYIKYCGYSSAQKREMKEFFNVNLLHAMKLIAKHHGYYNASGQILIGKVYDLIIAEVYEKYEAPRVEIKRKEISRILKPRKFRFSKNSGVIICAILSILKDIDTSNPLITEECLDYIVSSNQTELMYPTYMLSKIHEYISTNPTPPTYVQETEFYNNSVQEIYNRTENNNVGTIFQNIQNY